jgi:hypothetical protein
VEPDALDSADADGGEAETMLEQSELALASETALQHDRRGSAVKFAATAVHIGGSGLRRF